MDSTKEVSKEIGSIQKPDSGRKVTSKDEVDQFLKELSLKDSKKRGKSTPSDVSPKKDMEFLEDAKSKVQAQAAKKDEATESKENNDEVVTIDISTESKAKIDETEKVAEPKANFWSVQSLWSTASSVLPSSADPSQLLKQASDKLNENSQLFQNSQLKDNLTSFGSNLKSFTQSKVSEMYQTITTDVEGPKPINLKLTFDFSLVPTTFEELKPQLYQVFDYAMELTEDVKRVEVNDVSFSEYLHDTESLDTEKVQFCQGFKQGYDQANNQAQALLQTQIALEAQVQPKPNQLNQLIQPIETINIYLALRLLRAAPLPNQPLVYFVLVSTTQPELATTPLVTFSQHLPTNSTTNIHSLNGKVAQSCLLAGFKLHFVQLLQNVYQSKVTE